MKELDEALVEVQRRIGLVSARAINCTRVDELVAAEQAAMDAVRAAMLATHVDACMMLGPQPLLENAGQPRASCGDGWYCNRAKEIQELGR